MSKPLVIYHGRCADGFTAAWLANIYFYRGGVKQQGAALEFPDDWVVDPHAGVYGEPLPDVAGREVFVLDFSYSPDVMLALAEAARCVTWIDHHASAIKAMEGKTHPRLRQVTSIERSGAYLTSEYFWPDKEPADMVRLVDDRDRWLFRDPRSAAFAAGMFSRPYAIGEWNKLHRDVSGAVAEGEVILKKERKDIDEHLDVMQCDMYIDGQVVPSVNLSYMSASSACDEMLRRDPAAPFAVSWFVRKDTKKVFSLRSRNGSDVDVGAIAAKYGGGGHKHSAGFSVGLGDSV